MKCTPLLFLVIFVNMAFKTSAQTINPIPYGNNPAAGHTLHTRGFNMYYETYGQGIPLLLLHGNGGSIGNMANQIPYFAANNFQVIAIDTRAHGKSDNPADSLTFEMIVDDFNALLDSLHLDSCYIIGWSDGGIDALLMAIRHPGKSQKDGLHRRQSLAGHHRPHTLRLEHDKRRKYRPP
jgi:alpha-beta hydrolase superfamily lysophospholipase